MSLLPDKIIAPTKETPTKIIIYGAPKVGKTFGLMNREDLLLLDFEDGSSMYPCKRIDMRKDPYNLIMNVYQELLKFKIDNKSNKYKFIVFDTIDIIEEVADMYETFVYNKSVEGKKDMSKISTICDLAYGAGYAKIRNKVIEIIRMYEKVCDHLIIISHLKGKYTAGNEKKDNEAPVANEIDLTGKLSTMVCSLCDAIGFVSVDLSGKRYINFKKQSSLDIASGTRFSYLEKEKLEYKLDNIFPNNLK